MIRFAAGNEHKDRVTGDTFANTIWTEWDIEDGQGNGVLIDPETVYGWGTMTPPTGTYAIKSQLDVDSGFGEIRGVAQFPSQTAKWRLTCRVLVSGWPNEEGEQARLAAISAAPYGNARVNNDGTVFFSAVFGGAVKGTTSSWTLSTGVWHTLTIWYDGPAGLAKCWIDDQAALSVSDTGNPNNATYTSREIFHGQLLEKGTNLGMNLWVDDTVFNDALGSIHDWMERKEPIPRCGRHYVTADTSSDDWSGHTGGSDDGADYSYWDDFPLRADTADADYNFAASDGADLDQLSALTNHGLSGTDKIVYVVPMAIIKAVTGSTSDQNLIMDDGGTIYEGYAAPAGTANYASRKWDDAVASNEHLNQRPSGTDWTWDAFDAITVGMRRQTGGDANSIRCSWTAVTMAWIEIPRRVMLT